MLDLPVLRSAAPRVRAGSAGLGVRVRWVHVSEQRNPAGTLSGGELVLSIGVAVADPSNDVAACVAALRDAGTAGLVVELGQHVCALPTALVQAARAAEDSAGTVSDQEVCQLHELGLSDAEILDLTTGAALLTALAVVEPLIASLTPAPPAWPRA